MTTYTEASTVYDQTYTPRVTLTRDVRGKLTCTVELTGLDPDRDVNAEERQHGITSLSPPTVEARALAVRADTLRVLLDGTFRAVVEAIAATPGQPLLEPADLATLALRVNTAVRYALRAIGEEI